MNISIRKFFCAVACGSFLLAAVPAQAAISDWFTPKVALTVASIAGACWLVKKWFFGPLRINKIAELSLVRVFNKGEQLYITHDIALHGENPFTSNTNTLPAGVYTVCAKTSEELSPRKTTITLEPVVQTNPKRQYAFVFENSFLKTVNLSEASRNL